LRLSIRQTADVFRRFGALEEPDFQRAVALGRADDLVDAVGRWYVRGARRPAAVAVGAPVTLPASDDEAGSLDEVLGAAMRPFLSRCAEALQPRQELAHWTHPHCALCGGAPDLGYITPAADRHLVCGRCTLNWKYEPLTCPYCGNRERTRVTSFATTDGLYRVYGCDVCRRYLKVYDGRSGSRPVLPMVDSVATLPLDAAAIQRGYSAG
jgi:FdhE protein